MSSDDSVHAADTPVTSGTPLSSLVTLNIDLTHPNASVELTPHDNNGTFSSSSEDSSVMFDVSTNNYTGYTLYLSSPTSSGNNNSNSNSSNDSSVLTNTNTTLTTNNTLSSIEQVTSESDFSSTSSTNLNNKWGYKPSKYNGSDNTSFIPAPSITNPTTGSAILDTTATYNTTTNGQPITTETSISDINTNTYTIGLGARVDHTVATGLYEGTFVLQVVGNPVPVTITYTDTSGDTSVTSTLPSIYHGELSDTEAPISTTIPTRTGYTFKSWCLGEVTAGTSSNNYVDTCTGTTYNPSTEQNTQYIGVDLTHSNTMTLVAMWEKNVYNITLDRNGGNTGSTSTTVTYGTTTLSSITVPTRSNSTASRTVSGFSLPSGNNASGASVSSTSTFTSTATVTYTFNGWYEESSATNQIANTSATPALNANTTYTNSSSQWTYTAANAVTLYAGWNSSTGSYSSITLPTITKTGHTCGWTETSTGATNITYESGASITPSGNLTLYGVCTANKYSLTINFAGSGVSSVQVRTASGTGGTLMGTVSTSGGSVSNLVYGTPYYLYPSFSSNYEFSSWAKTSGEGTLSSTSTSNPTYTIGAGNGTVTVTGKSSKLFFQNATAAQCGQTMYDNRGTAAYKNIAYTTAKIGNLCWMTRNLDLPGGTTLTPADSNVSSDYTLPASSTSGFDDDTKAFVYNSGSTTCGNNSPCYSYYSYVAATAGTNPSSGNATSDICPKGWRLPTQAEYNSLKSTYTTGATLTASPWNGVYAGVYYGSGSFDDGGSYGAYWSSTADNSTLAYYLDFYSSNAHVNYDDKSYGYSVRCVAQ